MPSSVSPICNRAKTSVRWKSSSTRSRSILISRAHITTSPSSIKRSATTRRRSNIIARPCRFRLPSRCCSTTTACSCASSIGSTRRRPSSCPRRNSPSTRHRRWPTPTPPCARVKNPIRSRRRSISAWPCVSIRAWRRPCTRWPSSNSTSTSIRARGPSCSAISTSRVRHRKACGWACGSSASSAPRRPPLTTPRACKRTFRAHARLLDLPPEPLSGAYHQLGVDAPPPLKQVKRGVRCGSSSSLVPGVIVILVLGLAIALFAGLQNGERGIETPPAEDNHLTPPEALAPAVPPQNANEVAPGSAAGDVAATDEGANADAADVAVSAPTPPPSAETGTPAAAGPRATLSLKADQASWVEVRDANGRRLLYDLLDPGASRNVEGIAPFAVLLGYGPGVTVEFNGRLIDHRRYMREDVARFRVGEQGIDKL